MLPPFQLPPSPAYLVALSGGADSRLLLELTIRALSEREGERREDARLLAFHLHHGIRASEADRDEAFCRSLCHSLGVPLIVERRDIPALAEAAGESLETVARRERYNGFLRVMEAHDIPVLLTAHHADDNLETLLDRLLRGSGIRGMGGIPPTRKLGQLPDGRPMTVHRPLLSCTKAEILEACEVMGLEYVTDSTNASTDHTRNRLRHGVVPLLEDLTAPGVPQKAAARLSCAAREDEEALTALAAARYQALRTEDGRLPAATAGAELPAIAKRVILMAYGEFLGHPALEIPADSTLSSHHLEDLLALCRQGEEGDVSDRLPHGVCGVIRDGCLSFLLPSQESAPLPPHPRPLPEGDTVWDEGNGSTPRITIRVESGEAPLAPLTGSEVVASAVFPAAPLPLPLWARPRRSGDVILSHGLRKKLKKLLCDQGVPRELRDRLPLILLPDGTTPLWYPTAAYRDGYPAPSEGPCLRITVLLG